MKNHKDEEITLDELVEQYYNNPQLYFHLDSITVQKEQLFSEYIQHVKNLLETEEITDIYEDIVETQDDSANKLFEREESNKIIHPNENAEKELRDPYYDEFQRIISQPSQEEGFECTEDTGKSLDELIASYGEMMKKDVTRNATNDSVTYIR